MRRFSPSSAAYTVMLIAAITGDAVLTTAAPGYTAELYHDLPLADETSTRSGLVPALGRLFFIHGMKLWSLGADGVTAVNEMDVQFTMDMSWSNFGEGATSTAVMGGNLYFFAGDDENSVSLWKTDGTDAGTMMVKDINTVAYNGVTLSSMMGSPQIVTVNELIYFYSLDENGLPRLYESDGTGEGTKLIQDGSNSPLPASTKISYITEYNNKIYFPADGQVCETINSTTTCDDGMALFVLEDGLQARQAVNLTSPLATMTEDTNMKVHDGLLFFQTADRGLFRTDGTQEGTISFPLDGNHFTSMEDALYFTCSSEIGSIHKKSICKTDGTVGGTSIVANVTSSVGFSKGLTPLGDKILFHNRKRRNGVIKPHVFDPFSSRNNVNILADLDTTDVYSNYIVHEDHAFFKAEQTDGDAMLGLELYVTDGTQDGTVLVKDINPGMIGSNIRSFGIFEDNLYFIAYTVNSGNDIWKVDKCPDEGCPTPQPTPPTPAPTPNPNTVAVTSPGSTAEPGISTGQKDTITGDGTLASPARLYTAELYQDLPLADENSTRSGFIPALDRLFFIHGMKLWSLGANDVSLLNDNEMAWSNFGEGDASTAVMEGKLYFFAGNDKDSFGLWKTDGTEAGTVMVKDINTVASDGVTLFSLVGDPQIVAFNEHVYFYSLDESGLPRLYRSDGTGGGTQLAEDSSDSPLPASTKISYITEYNGKAYFPADGQVCRTTNGTTTCEAGKALFVLEDGLPARQVVNLTSPLATTREDTNMKVHNGSLFVQTTGGLLRTDGSQEGTISFPLDGSHFTSTADALYFTCSEIGSNQKKSICKTDGTVNGTSMIANVSSVGFSKGLTPLGDKILFHNRKKRNDVIKPHVLDPAAPSRKNVDILADLDTTDIYSNYIVYDDHAFFKAEQKDEGNDMLGLELYVTDGTQDGTLLVKDINPGMIGSNIRSFGILQDSLYFLAYTVNSGNDIWKVERCPDEGCPTPQPTMPPTPAPSLNPNAVTFPSPDGQAEVPISTPERKPATATSDSAAMSSKFYFFALAMLGCTAGMIIF